MEQAKKRRKPNFFDILLILLVLAAVAAAYLLSHRDSAGQKEFVSRSYVLELTNIPEDMADCVSAGAPVTDNVKNYALGTVTAVETVEYTTPILDEEARIVRQAPLEGFVNLLLTVEADTVDAADSISTASGYALRTGSWLSVTAGQLYAEGYILTVER